MAATPTIPMSPSALPAQRLYLVPNYPQPPAGWRAEMSARVPGGPARMPRSARYIAQVEWSWSPMHGRIDAYHLSLSRARDRWVLWCGVFDEELWRFVHRFVASSAPRAGLQGGDAAILLLQAYWAHESQDEAELDRFHWINQEGLLGAGQLKEIARRVWPSKR